MEKDFLTLAVSGKSASLVWWLVKDPITLVVNVKGFFTIVVSVKVCFGYLPERRVSTGPLPLTLLSDIVTELYRYHQVGTQTVIAQGTCSCL